MTAAVLAGPGVVVGLSLIVFATPWLERVTGLLKPPSPTLLPEPATRLEGPVVVQHIRVQERSSSCTSV